MEIVLAEKGRAEQAGAGHGGRPKEKRSSGQGSDEEKLGKEESCRQAQSRGPVKVLT